MVYDQILVRFGDLTLKGRNQKVFLTALFRLVKLKMNGLDVYIETRFDRIYIHLKDTDYKEVIERLKYVSGISSYSLVKRCEKEIEEIKENALALIKDTCKTNVRFKVETKRADKTFPLRSLETTKAVSAYVLSNMKNLKVDVHDPEIDLKIEIRQHGAYLFISQERGLGGFPVGTLGKGLLMLSGGIDSPVAGFEAMRQGIEIECIHFESTPLTSIESAQKVIDLAKIMAKWAPNNKICVHFIPFKEIHMALLDNVDESYNITIMRRMMYRIAEKIAKKSNCLCIVNGESAGQVASQTLQSMNTINNVTSYPILRPLCTQDKRDTIDISKQIGTYDISIKPFEDCCTVYVPKNPTTQPRIDRCLSYEKRFDYETMIDRACENENKIIIDVDDEIDLASYGFDVSEALAEREKERHGN